MRVAVSQYNSVVQGILELLYIIQYYYKNIYFLNLSDNSTRYLVMVGVHFSTLLSSFEHNF